MFAAYYVSQFAACSVGFIWFNFPQTLGGKYYYLCLLDLNQIDA